MTAQKRNKTPRKPQNPELQSLMDQAISLQARGQLHLAEGMLREVLQKQPRHAEAWHLLGLIAHQVGHLEQALDLTGKAIALNGNVPIFHSNRGEMCRQAGRFESALAHCKKAVKLSPRMASAHCNLGLAWFSKGEYQNARECQQKALVLNPAMPAALNNLGTICQEEHDLSAAMDLFRRAIDADPYYVEAYSNLGAVLVMDERYEEAVVTLSNVLAIDDDYAEAHYNLGVAFKELEQLEESFSHFEKALQINQEYVEAYIGLGKIFLERDQLNDAEQMALNVIELDHENVEANLLLGEIFVENDNPELACTYYDKALKLDPESSTARNKKGTLCVELGEFDQAEELFRQSVDTSPEGQISGRYHLAQVKQATAGDENTVALLDMEKELCSFSERRRVPVHFALGKIYDDLGEYGKASSHYFAGNELKRKCVNYDPSAQGLAFDTIVEAFGEQQLTSLQKGGISTELPVFVLGMPRSGTTLVEQILASHPEVHGAGELREMPRIAHRSIEVEGEEACFPENLKRLTPAAITLWAKDYLEHLRSKNSLAKRITDKMPGNFLFVGLIKCMFPEAKIVHVKRNPMDTCLSCFTHLFQKGQEYSYELFELGQYYSKYQRLMEHWLRTLPEGSFYSVEYESLIQDTENQTRALIEYCGLEWHPGCLEFHSHKRKVRTASVVQVRQPIYQSSVERWRNYEEMLQPLIKALGPLAR